MRVALSESDVGIKISFNEFILMCFNATFTSTVDGLFHTEMLGILQINDSTCIFKNIVSSTCVTLKIQLKSHANLFLQNVLYVSM